MNYCRRCGSELARKNAHVYVCENEHTIFANASPCVGILLFDGEDNILLSVRGIEPHKGMLDTIGGFVDGDESIEDAVARELHEELRLDPTMYSTPVWYSSSSDLYPYAGEDILVLSSFFYTSLKPDAKPVASDDVAEIYCAKLHDIDLNRMHSHDSRHAIIKLREIFPI